jgi:hypothetical protein
MEIMNTSFEDARLFFFGCTKFTTNKNLGKSTIIENNKRSTVEDTFREIPWHSSFGSIIRNETI